VVHHPEGEVGTPNLPPGLSESLEGEWGGYLVGEMPIDVYE
jgi:hypothetical protein